MFVKIGGSMKFYFWNKQSLNKRTQSFSTQRQKKVVNGKDGEAVPCIKVDTADELIASSFELKICVQALMQTCPALFAMPVRQIRNAVISIRSWLCLLQLNCWSSG